ncbi:hypothetical protein CQ13_35085 [Bradyrhizobium retamae]|uniref:Tetratricopeptide repeat protein n=1 Tax=Bradyrhizobium retamae TaxID=1300035 RepID=A0A0R3MKD2_9BRAD|nr:hypothetical protein CQ13_35085 [Bradyrhizobium retamae]
MRWIILAGVVTAIFLFGVLTLWWATKQIEVWLPTHSEVAAPTTSPKREASPSERRSRANDAVTGAQGHASNKKWDVAIDEYNVAIGHDPTYAPAWVGRGLARQAKGEYAIAIGDLSEAIRLDPTSADYYNLRGACYKLSGDDARAIADYSEAIKLKKDGAFYYNRGAAYFAQKKFEEAERDLTDSLQSTSADYGDYTAEAKALLEHTRKERSLVKLIACNGLTEQMWVNLAGYSEANADHITFEVLWDLAPGSCEDVGRFVRDKGVWVIVNALPSQQRFRAAANDASAKSFCTDNFGSTQVPYPSGTCPTNWNLQKFYKLNIKSNANVHTSRLPHD